MQTLVDIALNLLLVGLVSYCVGVDFAVLAGVTALVLICGMNSKLRSARNA